MTEATTEFFQRLSRGWQPAFEEVVGTLRFDLTDERGTDHWLLTVRHGEVSVSRSEQEADCVMRTDKELFDRLVRGEANPQAAWLRHRVKVDGDLRLIRLFSRTYPGPPGARDPRALASSHQRP